MHERGDMRAAKVKHDPVKVAATLMVAFLLALLVATPAFAARQQIVSSVDCRVPLLNKGCTIRYQVETRYADTTSWSVAQWNRLPVVAIRRDTATTLNDLSYRNQNRGVNNNIVATWTYYPGLEDVILYNNYWMNRINDVKYYGVSVHETGHALGLGHPSDSNKNSYLATHSIMYYIITGNFDTWRRYDRVSYNQRWG